jgi:hypothetical protein
MRVFSSRPGGWTVDHEVAGRHGETVGWRQAPVVIAWRAAHALIAVGFLTSIGHVWWCGLTGRKGPFLRPAVGALVAEGACVIGNHGDCPLGKLGDRVGDPVPLFELVLSPVAARRAVPALGAVTVAGFCLVGTRSWRGRWD